MAKTDGATPSDATAKLASPARVAAFRTGVSAETRAAAYLMAKGYRILAKRFRTPYGEIDLVARKRNLLVFVEVKARGSLDEAAYAVTPRQQQRIINAAQAWLMAHPEHAEFDMRFDAMLIAPRRLLRHLLAAFDASVYEVYPPASPDLTHEIERRRPDGPHRAHQHPRRFHFRAAPGSPEARPQPFLLHPRQALAARRELVAPVQVLTVRDEAGDHFTLGEPKREPLTNFDVILLRQDPPFDLAYITSTHFLERIHPRTLVVNNPASVRDAPEKLFVMNFPKLMPPTLISRDLDEINAFRDTHGAVVMKPLHGHGGAAVFRVMPQDMNFGSLFDMFSVTFKEPWVIQRFLPEVKHGDKRIVLVDGEFAGAVNRVPAPDDLRSNMVRGGAAQSTDLSEREREICATLGPALRERGLLFVGIDVIDGNLTEINVTSPTGIRAIARLGGPDVAAMIWDSIEAKRAGK